MKQTIDTLERLWAAIGDRLLANGPLDKAYAHAVSKGITDEIARLKAMDRAPAAPPSTTEAREERRDALLTEAIALLNEASRYMEFGDERGNPYEDAIAWQKRCAEFLTAPALTDARMEGRDNSGDKS